jgi:integrase
MMRIYSPATANRYLSAVRGVVKEAWRLELIDRETMEKAVDVPPVRGRREQQGRVVAREELLALFRACKADENRAAGARDAAILALLYGSGLRRSEATALTIDDLDWSDCSGRLIGKGNKERQVFLPAGTVAALKAWLKLRGGEHGPLITQIGKNGRVRIHGITDQLVYHIVRKRHLQAEVDPFTPHDLRRSFISELLDEGVDLAMVARQVGHSNVQTTARYDRRDQSAQQRGVLRLDVPFSKV